MCAWRALRGSQAASLLAGGALASVLMYSINKRRNKITSTVTGTSPSQHPFAGKTVLITGAAGDIGDATARAFARKGASLVLADLPSCQQVLMERREELQGCGAESVQLVAVDVSKSEDVERMVSEAVQQMGHIDCFFNNAGLQGQLLPIYEQSEEAFRRTLQVNVLGVFLGMKYVAMAMRERGQGGVIINTASLAGLHGPPNMAAYGASKFAVVGLTQTASKDLAPYNIRVCAIAPGLLEGKMWHSQVKGQAECAKNQLGEGDEVSDEEIGEMEDRLLQQTPMKRLGKLSEVADVVVFLCSKEASYLTGTVINIDGGRLG